MGEVSNRVERVEPVGVRGHERYLMQRHYGSPIIIIICQQLFLHNDEHSTKKESVYRTAARDPYRGNRIDIRL